MAALIRHSCSSKLPSLLSTFLKANRVICEGINSVNIVLQPKRTLLSDAYHAEDTWINRERIVVDMDEMKINLDRAFYDLKEPVMSVELHKFIDNVYDKEELDVAEGYLHSYRYSPVAHHLRQSTVHSWLRLCMELGYPDQALSILQKKRDYGLFPESFTYNLLLDTFLRADNIKGACDVAIVMMREETLENCHLSQLLALYACHQCLKAGEIPQEELWDIGMTLADSTRDMRGILPVSYHAIGYTMTGKLDKAIRVLESVATGDDARIAKEAIDRLEAALNGLEEPSEEMRALFETALTQLTQQDKIFSESLDTLLEPEVLSKLPSLEQRDIDGYTALLEGWHSEHMEALERQRLAVLDHERREKEKTLDRLMRSVGGIDYWKKDIEEAKQRREAEKSASQQADHS